MNNLITRRQWLEQTGLVTAAALLGRRPNGWAHSGHAPMPAHTSPHLTPFKDPLPIPTALEPVMRGKTAFYALSMRESLARLHSELPPSRVWGYNGVFSTVLIRAKAGRPVVVRQYNDLPPHSAPLAHMHVPLPAVHLHGARVRPEDDGHPMHAIPWGGSRDYHYPNQQKPLTMLFHDHAHEATGYHVWMGLAGFYILDDPVPNGLPAGEFDIPLLIQDRSIREDGSLLYPTDAETRESGATGDCLLVNGVVQPRCDVAKALYRFRIANGSNARMYELRLSDGRPFVQVGTDGGLFRTPQARTSLQIAPFERVEIVVDFADYPIGSSVVLKNGLGTGRTADIMRFDVSRPATSSGIVPDCLAEWMEINPSEASARREFTLDRHTTSEGATWTINNQIYAHDNPPLAEPKLGSVEIWKFRNPTTHPHPMHLHLVQFQVLEVNGVPQDPALHGWKDTVVVPPAGEVTIIARFDGYAGRYLFHCHNLEHEDLGMMGEFVVRD